MSKLVRTIGWLLYAPILIFGFYVIMHGHLTPGGGFQGGAVVASGFALLIVAYGAKGAGLKERLLSVVESGGALIFVGLAFLGLGATFFYNFLAAGGGVVFNELVPPGPNPGDLNTAGTLPLMNWAVGLKVLAGLGSIVLLLALFPSEEE
ncbi:MAG: sodium:proton antiporter [Candidatus Acetothermia bacterium]|jgi:multicomponent Na+:H+ antiporter subunit B|nr:sodium:proton antiporter [Candidatus Acetothermia bacterium]MDH7505634.1 MnhB domain-containing protein [Candidatus Acetothermia bacterium]